MEGAPGRRRQAFLHRPRGSRPGVDSCRQTPCGFDRLGIGLKSLRPLTPLRSRAQAQVRLTMSSCSTSASQQSASSWVSWRTPAKTRATSSGNLEWVFTPLSWWRAKVEVFTKTYDATKGSQSCPTHVAIVAKRARSSADRCHGSRRQHTICLFHLPHVSYRLVLLLCVFGSTFSIIGAKSFAVRRSSKLPRQSQHIRAELSSTLSQSSFGCLRQVSIPVSWVEHHYS